jgi:hypothetical protein
MTRFLISAATLLALTAVAASAAEMPKELRGVWCATAQENIYRSCREADSEDNLDVSASKFYVAEGTECVPLSITRNTSGHFVVRASCTFNDGARSGRVLQRWRLFNSGRRLEIRDANTGPSGIEPTKIGIERTVPLPQPRPYTYLPPEAQPTEEEKQEAWRSVQGELPWAKPLPHLPAATPATQASEKWERDFRQCHIRKWFSVDELAEMAWQRDTGWTIIIEEDQIGDLEKAMRVIKKCKAFQKCLGDRHAGKVKRCYYNDKRWQLDEK